ncbi:MAG: crossover junction endodeoxyribonuclease RuvC [Candidatus Zixiibacteriota bacterium]
MNCPADDMIVLGIDPGLRTVGYGLVEKISEKICLIEGGVLRPEIETDLVSRVGEIFSGITNIITEFKPDFMAMEDLYSHYKHPKTAIIMAHARGAILAAANQLNLPVSHYPATMIKNSLVGQGRATKEQVREMASSILGLNGPAEPLDTYDAIAVALCHINQNSRMILA